MVGLDHGGIEFGTFAVLTEYRLGVALLGYCWFVLVEVLLSVVP